MEPYLNIDSLLDSGTLTAFIQNLTSKPFKELFPSDRLLVSPHSKSGIIHAVALKKRHKTFDVPLTDQRHPLVFYKAPHNEHNPTHNRGVYFIDLDSKKFDTTHSVKIETHGNFTGPIYNVIEGYLEKNGSSEEHPHDIVVLADILSRESPFSLFG